MLITLVYSGDSVDHFGIYSGDGDDSVDHFSI